MVSLVLEPIVSGEENSIEVALTITLCGYWYDGMCVYCEEF